MPASSTGSNLNAKLFVICFATAQNRHLDRLINSVKANCTDARMIVHGLGTRFIGFGQKAIAYIEELKAIDPSQVCLLIDGYDMLVLQSADAILRKFHAMHKRIVWSAMSICWPDRSFLNYYSEAQRAEVYPYLCAGGCIGYASELLEFYTAMQCKESDDDQQKAQALLFSSPKYQLITGFDCTQAIFQNEISLHRSWLEFDSELGLYRNTQTGEYPCVFHATGPKDGLVLLDMMADRIPIDKVRKSPVVAVRESWKYFCNATDTTLVKKLLLNAWEFYPLSHRIFFILLLIMLIALLVFFIVS